MFKKTAFLAMLIALVAAFVFSASQEAQAKPKVPVAGIYGKIQVVNSFPDYKVKIVQNFPDLKVKSVQNFPDSCGKWQFVESFPDYKIQFVEDFPDFTIQFVENFPGLP